MSKELSTLMELLEVLLTLAKRVFDFTPLSNEDSHRKRWHRNHSQKKLHRQNTMVGIIRGKRSLPCSRGDH
jgi:hypothetical protein